MPWDHIDAGVAHLLASGNRMVAWLVRAHHAPGLPCLAKHFDADGLGLKLRGRRHESVERSVHLKQIEHTNGQLSRYLTDHIAAVNSMPVSPTKASHGLAMRLALSCLVDADYSDTAAFDSGVTSGEPASPRWQDRLHALDAYVEKFGRRGNGTRDNARTDFYGAARDSSISSAFACCEAPWATKDQLSKAEKEKDYSGVAKYGRVILADTRIVVVDSNLADRLKAGERLSFHEVLSGSVQIWAGKIETLGLKAIPGRQELYVWAHEYDNFLGYMAGILQMRGFLMRGGEII